MKILAVTTTRADWGLLAPVLGHLSTTPGFQIDVAVTGQHLVSPESLTQIRDDGFSQTHRIAMPLPTTGDMRPSHLTAGVGEACAQTGALIERLSPDLMMILGDRYELLPLVTAATIARLPIAHLCGGDLTFGAFDDAIRHAVSKLSHLHFVSSADAAQRLAQMGEDPARIVESGSPGIDRILALPPMSKGEFCADLGLNPNQPFALISLHPETLGDDPLAPLDAVLQALQAFPDLQLLLSGSNLDPGGPEIDAAFGALAKERPNAVFRETLGSLRYFSALRHADVMIGNSSSGLYEAPSFSLPTVNIGSRQAGRLKAPTVIDADAQPDVITQAIAKALTLSRECSMGEVTNPYGTGKAAEIIAQTLGAISNPAALLQKRFVDWEHRI
ncbi:MAG: UDP-N-acetylglucosamine 2-epimerase [Pelagimonas sp.]|nr:UDP-N-acetylglucosamine 2-epimerase [Pelagimonas sp.]